MSDSFQLDRRAVRRWFDRAGANYDGAATLQHAVRNELLERLQYFRLAPRAVLDLGTGTGDGALQLRRQFRRANVIAADVAPGMLREARRRQWPWSRFACVCADATALPLPAGSVDLVFCNLMLQWCDDPLAAFREIRRVLRPGGLLLFSSFGPDTLHELRTAWAQADSQPHVIEFLDMPQLGDAMGRSGLTEPVMDRDPRLNWHADVPSLVRELRAIGARNAAAHRRRGLMAREPWRRMTESYERLRTAKGLPATYEVIFGAAFAGAAPTGEDGEVRVPLDSIRRRT